MAVKIVILRNNKPIDQCLVTTDVIMIGRKSDCEISVKDPAVSGNHAKIQRVGANWLIEDLGSTNGTYVGTKRVTKQALKANDVVRIGEHQLKFVIESERPEESKSERPEASKSERPEASKSERARASEDAKPVLNQAPGSRPAASITSRGYLTVTSGKQAGDVIPLEEALTTIGQPGVQVAAVSKRPQGYFIIHVDGGKDRERVPLVNGEPTGFRSQKLESGDKIEVAGIEMEFATE